MRRDRITLPDRRINPHVTVSEIYGVWQPQMKQSPRRWQKPFFGVFSIDTRLDRMTINMHILLL